MFLTLYWSLTRSTTFSEFSESVPAEAPSICCLKRSYTLICSAVTAKIMLIEFCLTFKLI